MDWAPTRSSFETSRQVETRDAVKAVGVTKAAAPAMDAVKAMIEIFMIAVLGYSGMKGDVSNSAGYRNKEYEYQKP